MASFRIEFPDSMHVMSLVLDRSSDQEVWEYAKKHGYTIVSKDADYHQRSLVYGFPPKVIWIRSGNCTTIFIESIMRRHREDIIAFESSEGGAFLALI